MSDGALVLAAQRGDTSAIGELYRRYAPVVHGVLLASGVGAEAEDLTQEVFVDAVRGLAGVREAGAFGGWIVMAARHRASNWKRGQARGRQAVLAAGGVERPRDADGDVAVLARRAMEAIGRLPEAYRETLVLRLVEGLTGPQIAERTGLSPGSVRVNLHRGMELLRERLKGGVG